MSDANPLMVQSEPSLSSAEPIDIGEAISQLYRLETGVYQFSPKVSASVQVNGTNSSIGIGPYSITVDGNKAEGDVEGFAVEGPSGNMSIADLQNDPEWQRIVADLGPSLASPEAITIAAKIAALRVNFSKVRAHDFGDSTTPPLFQTSETRPAYKFIGHPNGSVFVLKYTKDHSMSGSEFSGYVEQQGRSNVVQFLSPWGYPKVGYVVQMTDDGIAIRFWEKSNPTVKIEWVGGDRFEVPGRDDVQSALQLVERTPEEAKAYIENLFTQVVDVLLIASTGKEEVSALVGLFRKK